MTYELYIVITVIGVLAAIALPAYFDYMTRVRISEGLVVVAGARDAVAKAFEAGGPADMSQPANTGWSPSAATRNVAGVSIARSGTVTLLYSAEVAEADANQLQLVPTVAGQALDLSDPASRGAKFEWQCGGAAGKTTVKAKYLSSACRHGPSAGGGWIGALVAFVGGAIVLWIVFAIAWAILESVWSGLRDREVREEPGFRAYRVTAGWMLTSLVLGGVVLTYGVFMAWKFAHEPGQDDMARMIWVSLGWAIGALGAGAIGDALISRLLLTPEVIELRGLLGTRRLRRNQIAGYRRVEQGMGIIGGKALIPIEGAGGRLVLWPMVRMDAALQAWLESFPDLDATPATQRGGGVAAIIEGGLAADERRKKRAGLLFTAALCVFIGAGAYALADGPWDSSQLKTVVGTVEGHREYGGTHPCFAIRLSEFQESFELCSTSYSKFDLEAYKRDVRKGSLLVLRVVDEIKRDRSAGGTKYWVQDVRLSDARVYLDLNAVQEYRKGERVVGIAIAAVLAVVAAWALWKAFVRRS